MDEILDSVVCPISKEKLSIIIFDFFEFNNQKVKSGLLYCNKLKIFYPIINGVPIMLTFPTVLTLNFKKKYENEIQKKIPNYKLPKLQPMKGEKSIQKTFTEEWNGLGDDEIVFMYDKNEGYNLHKKVWLSSLSQKLCNEKKKVLDVGCGAGREAEYLAKIFPNANIYAVDLNLALVGNGEKMIQSGQIVPIVCSIFNLPFNDNKFDHVHCQCVMHHTYDTYEAFKKVEKMVGLKNSSFFVWVYAWEDSFGIKGLRGMFTHLYYFISHRIFRPFLSRLPSQLRWFFVWIISFVYHYIIKIFGNSNHENWNLNNTTHAVRDMFTPRYAHRHRHNEVHQWFEEHGYNNITFQLSKTYYQLFKRRILGIGFLGQKLLND
jgi:ubiquinone/menaquinone biosynthesis C-methylase UbiE/uncharacterized protein YbaR (Trm112 family)